ncbi:MAG: hypothetical protein P4L53_12250 [Candidatus Obscuribacterales bacterium]|nr:hypothetical protein [Candidatus Obscuribacterales bacterium]
MAKIKGILKIIAIASLGTCICGVALPIIMFISDVSSVEYETERLPEIIKVSLDGKYLAKVYDSNFQPPFWTFRPLRLAGVYIQRRDTKQEWLIAQLKEHIWFNTDVAWQTGDSIVIFSDATMNINPVDIGGKKIEVKILPALK